MLSSKSLGILLAGLLTITLFTSCSENTSAFRIDYSLAEALLFDTTGVERRVTDSGLIIYEIEPGNGLLEVVARDNILLYYTIRFQPNDDIIESSYANNSTFPLQFNGVAAASSRVGGGFVEGVIGMKEGGKRVLVVPPSESVYSDTVIVDLELDAILF